MRSIVLMVLLLLSDVAVSQTLLLPINVPNRSSIDDLELTEIGKFGLRRKARPTVKSHLHTGIDIRRPNNDYDQNPVFPIAPGIVISLRNDGPYAKIIVEHQINQELFWSVYEHIAGIRVQLGDAVDPSHPIARFMNRTELEKYGWQFDHFHLEIMKIPPIRANANPRLPDFRFNSYTLMCFNDQDLDKYFFEPISFLKEHLRN